MNLKSLVYAICGMVIMTMVMALPQAAFALTPVERLGKMIFFDKDLSVNRNQSCASCHAPSAGWTGPQNSINKGGAVYEGSVPGLFGNRKPPSSAYATPSPIFTMVAMGQFMGGNFWDGRATGQTLGSPAAEQAKGPFLNPLEQALPNAQVLVDRVCRAGYGHLFRKIWGADACTDIEKGYNDIAFSIAAYEGSSDVNQFSSKYDAYLAGRVSLTAKEEMGLNLFEGKGKCSNCHISQPGSNGEAPLLTDYTFDNLGVPKNPLNPFYTNLEYNPLGYDWVDPGLGGFLQTRADYAAYAAENLGKQKVPTLRNVDKRPFPMFVKAYTHNGYFKSLEQVVHFYNTRDIPGYWPEPEEPLNMNTTEMGDLGLTASEEDAIVAFLKTLTDGYFVP